MFIESIRKLETAVNMIQKKNTKINLILEQLKTSEFTTESLEKMIHTIQEVADDFSFNDMSNLHKWTDKFNDKIEIILAKRLDEMVQDWISEFSDYGSDEPRAIKYCSVHEIKLRDKQITLEPNISEMRAYWYGQFYNCIQAVEKLNKLQKSRYDSRRDTS